MKQIRTGYMMSLAAICLSTFSLLAVMTTSFTPW